MNDNNASFNDYPDLEDRQAAERKLCRLFKSFGIDALAFRSRLIDAYLDRAADFWRPGAGTDFAALALREAKTDLEAWFSALLGENPGNRETAVMTGRAAFLMCGGPSNWADQFLKPLGSLDPKFVSAIGDHAPTAVPPSELGEMHHQPYIAWSPSNVVLKPFPTERGLFQGLAGFLRRDAA